jgi:hypothetical protein
MAASDGTPGGEWIWCDSGGRSDPPTSGCGDVRVDHSVLALEYVTGTAASVGLICFLVWIPLYFFVK